VWSCREIIIIRYIKKVAWPVIIIVRNQSHGYVVCLLHYYDYYYYRRHCCSTDPKSKSKRYCYCSSCQWDSWASDRNHRQRMHDTRAHVTCWFDWNIQTTFSWIRTDRKCARPTKYDDIITAVVDSLTEFRPIPSARHRRFSVRRKTRGRFTNWLRKTCLRCKCCWWNADRT